MSREITLEQAKDAVRLVNSMNMAEMATWVGIHAELGINIGDHVELIVTAMNEVADE